MIQRPLAALLIATLTAAAAGEAVAADSAVTPQMNTGMTNRLGPATIAPAPIPPKAGNNKVEVRRDSTGNISGTLIPAPADQR